MGVQLQELYEGLPQLIYIVLIPVYMQILNIPIVNTNNFTQFNILPFKFKIPLNNVINITVCFNDATVRQKIYGNNL